MKRDITIVVKNMTLRQARTLVALGFHFGAKAIHIRKRLVRGGKARAR